MADARSTHDLLVAHLVADLKPVRPIGSPWGRALSWIALVIALAVVLAWFADMPAVEHRLMATPDMWLAVVGSTLTAVLGAVAVFQLGLPDRSPWWAALPLPALALWLGASGLGCARTWLIPSTTDATLAETGRCLRFIIGLSIPLAAVIFLLLRRGYSLYPSLTGAIAGLAVAAAAASLLTFLHPFDASVTDLAVHAGAVMLVVGVNRMIGGLVFGSRMPKVAG